MTTVEAQFILGLRPTFTPHELKTAYHNTAANHHPDKGGSEERMKLVNEAYQVLATVRTRYGPYTAPALEQTYEEYNYLDTDPTIELEPTPDCPLLSAVCLNLMVFFWVSVTCRWLVPDGPLLLVLNVIAFGGVSLLCHRLTTPGPSLAVVVLTELGIFGIFTIGYYSIAFHQIAKGTLH